MSSDYLLPISPIIGRGRFEVRRHTALQAGDQLLIHVLVVISDLETDDFLAAERFAVLCLEPAQVPLLHDEDDVRPAEMPGRYSHPRTGLGTR